jgi:hypothetical protein
MHHTPVGMHVCQEKNMDPIADFLYNSRCGLYQTWLSLSGTELHWISMHLDRKTAEEYVADIRIACGYASALADIPDLLRRLRQGKMAVIVDLPERDLAALKENIQQRWAAQAHYNAVHKEFGRLWAQASHAAGQIRDREIEVARKNDTYTSREMLAIENRHDRRMWQANKLLQAERYAAHERLARACGFVPKTTGEAKPQKVEQLMLW